MDLISSITSSLGVDPQAAKGAAGSVLALLKQQAPPDAFAAVEQKVPESNEWLAAAPSAQPEGGGDLLGGIAGALGLGGSAGGGGAGGGLLGGLAGLGGLISALSKLGLSADSLGKLVPLVLKFLQTRLGDGTVARLIEAVPALSGLKPAAPDQKPGDSPLGGLTDLFK